MAKTTKIQAIKPQQQMKSFNASMLSPHLDPPGSPDWHLVIAGPWPMSTALMECLCYYRPIIRNCTVAAGKQHGGRGVVLQNQPITRQFWGSWTPSHLSNIALAPSCHWPVTGLLQHGLQMCPGSHWPMSKNRPVTVKCLLFLKFLKTSDVTTLHVKISSPNSKTVNKCYTSILGEKFFDNFKKMNELAAQYYMRLLPSL